MSNNKQTIKIGYIGLIAFVLIAGMFFTVATAQADSIGLGDAGNYNVFVFNNFTSSNSDTGGSLAAGGNVSLQNYGLGTQLDNSFSGSSMVVGGDLYYRNGQIRSGNVNVGGTADVNQSVGTGSGSTISGNVSNLPVSFDAAKQQLTQLSQNLAQQAATGNAELMYSTLQLTGEASSNVQVFNVNASDISNASGWALDTSIPSDSYIILNITGENASMMNQGQQALNLFSDRVIFNFIDAKVLTLSGISVQGTILAPYADVVGNNGNMEGTLIANSFNGNLEFHNNQFVPQDPGPGPGTGGTVPEPGTMLLFGPVMAGMYWWNRRKKRSQAKKA